MRYTQYAVVDDGYRTPTGPSVTIGPTFIADSENALGDGYAATGSFVSKPIDLGNIQQFGALCAFLTGSSLTGTLSLQVCDDPQGPDGSPYPNTYASWLTLTAANTWGGSQKVAAVTVTSGAIVVPFEWALPGHRFIRFSWVQTGGSGTVSFAYNLTANK